MYVNHYWNSDLQTREHVTLGLQGMIVTHLISEFIFDKENHPKGMPDYQLTFMEIVETESLMFLFIKWFRDQIDGHEVHHTITMRERSEIITVDQLINRAPKTYHPDVQLTVRLADEATYVQYVLSGGFESWFPGVPLHIPTVNRHFYADTGEHVMRSDLIS